MTKREPRECKCGCGEWTRGGTFCPGHDARWHSEQRKLGAKVLELVEYFDNDRRDGYNDWLGRAARRFADYQGDFQNRHEVARAIITHPRMQDTDYNRRNGYRPYTTPQELYSRILRVCS